MGMSKVGQSLIGVHAVVSIDGMMHGFHLRPLSWGEKERFAWLAGVIEDAMRDLCGVPPDPGVDEPWPVGPWPVRVS